MTGNASAVRVRGAPGGVDSYGDPIVGTESRVLIPNAITAPRSTADLTEGARQGVVVGLTLYAPPGTDLRYDDQVEVDGVLYNVDGEAGEWSSPLSGWRAGVEAALVRASG